MAFILSLQLTEKIITKDNLEYSEIKGVSSEANLRIPTWMQMYKKQKRQQKPSIIIMSIMQKLIRVETFWNFFLQDEILKWENSIILWEKLVN